LCLVGTDSRKKDAAEPVQFCRQPLLPSFDLCFCLSYRLKRFAGTTREVQSLSPQPQGPTRSQAGCAKLLYAVIDRRDPSSDVTGSAARPTAKCGSYSQEIRKMVSVRDKSLQLASCWNCGSSLLLYDPEPPASPTVAEIIDLESAILTAVLGKSPDPRWSRRLCAKAFTEKLRFLMQHLTTATNDPLPPFFRIADADPHLRRYLFGRQRPGTRMEAMSWYLRFLLMIILVRKLNSRESGLSTI
jgi:hypothetical protein